MIGKIKMIALSRLKQVEEEEFVTQRRAICKDCRFNSKNVLYIRVYKRILKYFSDFYSLITFNKDVDTLGNCLACESCSIYYKTLEVTKSEICPQGKWKHIKLPRKPRTTKK